MYSSRGGCSCLHLGFPKMNLIFQQCQDDFCDILAAEERGTPEILKELSTMSEYELRVALGPY